MIEHGRVRNFHRSKITNTNKSPKASWTIQSANQHGNGDTSLVIVVLSSVCPNSIFRKNLNGTWVPCHTELKVHVFFRLRTKNDAKNMNLYHYIYNLYTIRSKCSTVYHRPTLRSGPLSTWTKDSLHFPNSSGMPCRVLWSFLSWVQKVPKSRSQQVHLPQRLKSINFLWNCANS